MSKELERCEICDEPTGNAGVGDDSIVCDLCGRVICEECIVDITTTVDSQLIICKLCEVIE